MTDGWSRDTRITVFVVIPIAILTLIAAWLVVPEARKWFHLDDQPSAQTSQTRSGQNVSQPASNQTAGPTKTEPGTPVTQPRKQRATTHVKGNGNVAGNNTSGDNNTAGNNNQTAPIAIAPNGIAITGGNVDHPTVNNYGPPPLPTPNIKVCVQPTTNADRSMDTLISIKTDAQADRPWFMFFFDGPVDKESVSMDGGIFGCNCPVRATKLPNPERSLGFRTTSVNMGSTSWLPGDGPIKVTISSKNPVSLIKVLAGEGDDPNKNVPVNLMMTCD